MCLKNAEKVRKAMVRKQVNFRLASEIKYSHSGSLSLFWKGTQSSLKQLKGADA